MTSIKVLTPLYLSSISRRSNQTLLGFYEKPTQVVQNCEEDNKVKVQSKKVLHAFVFMLIPSRSLLIRTQNAAALVLASEVHQ